MEKEGAEDFLFKERMTPALKEVICRAVAKYFMEHRSEIGSQWRQQDLDAIEADLVSSLKDSGLTQRDISTAVLWYTSDHQSYWHYVVF